MDAWIYILLSSFCSILVAHLLKFTEYERLDTLRVLVVNYFAASLIALLTVGGVPDIDQQARLIPMMFLAVVVGIIFIANFFIFSKSTHLNGLGISVAAMRLSLIIPVLLSTFWYLEWLEFREWAGVLLVFISLFLLLPEKGSLLKRPLQAGWLLLMIFLLTGIGDSSFKIFETEYYHLLPKEAFMGAVFLTAMVTGILVLTARNNWAFTRREVITGCLLGIPNLYSTLFLIEALALMRGGIVYTAANLLTVLGATLLGIVWWKDRLTSVQWGGIVLTLVSILLLI